MQKLGAGASYPLPSEVGSCILQGGEPVEKSPAGKGSGRSSEHGVLVAAIKQVRICSMNLPFAMIWIRLSAVGTDFVFVGRKNCVDEAEHC